MPDTNPKNELCFLNTHYLNLFKYAIAKINNDNAPKKFPICIFMSSFYNTLNLILEGVAGESKDVMNRENEYQILKRLITASPKSIQNRTAVLIRKGYSFNPNYIKKFEESSSSSIIFDFLPSDKASMKRINKKSQKMFPNWPKNKTGNNQFYSDKLINNDDDPCQIYIKDENWFEKTWRMKFELLEGGNFRNYKNSKLPMIKMVGMDEIFMYTDENKGCDFIHLPYFSGSGGMLIILPQKAMNTRELVEFCVDKISGEDIVDFYYSKGKIYKCQSLIMPKLKFDYDFEWDLTDQSSIEKFCPYLKTISDFTHLDLRGVTSNFKMGYYSIEVSSKTKFINNKVFTNKSKSRMNNNNLDISDGVIVNIDRGFLLASVEEDKKLLSFGLFNG